MLPLGTEFFASKIALDRAQQNPHQDCWGSVGRSCKMASSGSKGGRPRAAA